MNRIKKNLLKENAGLKQNKGEEKARFPNFWLIIPFLIFSFLISVFQVQAGTGVPKILHHQGRLLDASGNLLGGAGNDFCFQFSIYDDETVGAPDNKLWPSTDPSTMTVSVKNGVFNVGIGATTTGGDLLDFNFQDNDTVYLNVKVASKVGDTCNPGDGAENFENLAPRQRILSSGYSINASTLGGFSASQSASGNQIPVLNSGNLILGGTNPYINVTGSNTLNLGVTSTNVAIAGLNCSGSGNGGKLTTDSSGKIICASDETGPPGSGITSLNNLTVTTQFFASSTSGTDFSISSTGSTHTFYVPSASASSRGLLTSGDWTTFNNKVSSQWTNTSTGIYYSGGSVGIGTSSPAYTLDINGTLRAATSSFSSVNGLTITANGSNTLNIAAGKTLAVNNSLTFSGTDATVFTFPSASGTVVTASSSQTLTNKTISGSSNTLSNIATSSLTTSSLTVNAGNGLINGGLVGLGGSITLDVGSGFGITANANDIAVATSTNFTWAGTHAFNVTSSLLAITIGGDTINEFVGTGLALSGNSLTAYLGNSIETGEIADATITGDDINSNIAGAGLVLTAGSPDVLDIDLLSVSDGTGVTSSFSGIEFAGASSDKLALLQGCANNEILKWDEAGSRWFCATDATGGGGANSFETMDAPFGSDPVADSATDVLLLLINGTNFTVTGSSTADSLTFDIDESVLAGIGLVANGSALDIGVGNGIATSADAISVKLTTTGTSSNASSNSGLEVSSSGLALLRGCTNNQILKWATTSQTWACSDDLTGGGGSLTVRESDLSPSVTNVSTLEFGPATTSSDEFIVTDQTGGVARVVAGNKIVKTDASQALTNKTYEGLTITANGSNTLNIAASKTLVVNNSLTFSGTDATVFTFPNASGTVVTASSSQTLTNKTISGSSNTLSNIATSSLTTSSLTVNAGVGLINGGLVGLGSSITLDIGAGNGIATSTDAISINLTTTGTSSNASSNSGLEVSSSGLALLRGCANGQLLKWSSSTSQWQCSADVSGGSPTLDSIAAATTDGTTQDSNANTVNWNWDFTSAGVDAGLNISESSASINGTQDQQALAKITTLAGSTASPLQIISNSADVGDIFINLAGSGDFEIRDAGTAFVTFGDTGTTTFSGHLVLSSDANEGISGGGLVDCSSAGQVLQWDDATNKFSCGSVSSGVTGLLGETTLSDNSATLDVSLSGAKEYIHCEIAGPAPTATGTIEMRFDSDSGAASYGWTAATQLAGANLSDTQDASDDSIQLTGTNTPGTDFIFDIYFDNVSGKVKTVQWQGTIGKNVGTVPDWYQGAGNYYTTAGQIDVSVNFIRNAGNYSTGTYAWCEGKDVADFAENYYTKDRTIRAADVVTLDPSLPAGIQKSTKPYDPQLIGVISTKPVVVLDEGIGFAYGRPTPVALSGRVPVKVSTINGTIQTGDLLTSSKIPGVAMRATKAGPILGQALTSFDGEGIGMVVAFVNTSYFSGTKLASLLPGLAQDSSTSTDDFGKQILAQLITQKDTLNASSTVSEILTDRLAAGLEIISPRVLTQGLVVESISALDKEIIFKDDVIFFGRPYFTIDTAGFAIIKAGERKVDVTFEREYLEQPIVNASISLEEDNNVGDELIFGNGINYIITKKSVNGFTIVLNKAAPREIKFGWIALAVRGAKTFTSIGNTEPNQETVEPPLEPPDTALPETPESTEPQTSEPQASDESNPESDSEPVSEPVEAVPESPPESPLESPTESPPEPAPAPETISASISDETGLNSLTP